MTVNKMHIQQFIKTYIREGGAYPNTGQAGKPNPKLKIVPSS